MLRSFAPLLGKVIPGITGGLTGITILYLIFALADAEKGERLGIFVRSMLGLIIMIVLAIVATLAFSLIALIGFIVVALWLFGSNN